MVSPCRTLPRTPLTRDFRAHCDGEGDGVRRLIPGARGNPYAAAFVALIVLSVAPPFVPIAGPLSADDVLPLVAVLIGSALLVRSRPHPSSVEWLLAGFALLGLASSIANADDPATFVRLAARSTGRALFYAALALSASLVIATPERAHRALLALSAVATAESLFGLGALALRYQGPYGIGVQELSKKSHLYGALRIQGTFGGVPGPYEHGVHAANFLAAYLLLGIFATLACALASRGAKARIGLALAAVLQLVATYLTYTRAALIALAAGVLAFGFLLGGRRAALAAVVLGIALSAAIPAVRLKFLDDHNRFALYAASLEIIRDHPWLGVGDGRYEEVLHARAEYMDTPFGAAKAAAHNSLLLSAAYHGLLGAVLYAALCLAVAQRIRRSIAGATGTDRVLAAGIGAALAALFVQDQMNNLFYIPKVATQAWFLVGLLGCLRARDARRQSFGEGAALGRSERDAAQRCSRS
jgi:O-antigen ligase